MAFREVTMLEVKEVLRLWLLGIPKNRLTPHWSNPPGRKESKPGN